MGFAGNCIRNLPAGAFGRQPTRPLLFCYCVTHRSDCSHCWTSCRGFVECMFQPPRRRQWKEFLTSVRPR